MNDKDKEIYYKKRMSAFSLALMIIFLCVAIILIPLFANSDDDMYIKVLDAIQASENQKEFLLEFSTASEIFVGTESKRTDATGYIVTANYPEDVMIYVNTFSTTSYDTQSDYNVTASLFCDSNKVYDCVTGKNVEVDMTPEEFRKIIDSYSLYLYDPKNATSVNFAENKSEAYKGSGNVTVELSTPGDDILMSFSDAIYESVGERFSTDDLKINKATVTYKIFYDMVIMQRYDFSVSCTLSNSETLTYTASSYVSYNTEYIEDADEDYEYYSIDETQEVISND